MNIHILQDLVWPIFQKEMVEEFVTALQKLDDQQYLASFGQNNVMESDDKPNNVLQPCDGEIIQVRSEIYETDLVSLAIDSAWSDGFMEKSKL